MGKLVFNKKQDGDFLVLSIGGTIDTGVAPEFEKSMKDAAGGASKVIGDLSGLEHITSAGLGVIIAENNELKASGGAFVLCNVSDKIMKVFSLMNLTKLVKTVSTLDDAKKSF